MARQDMPDCDAEGGLRRLDQGEHTGYMNEGIENFKIGKRGAPAFDRNRSSHGETFTA
jgi:hypothetical protein